MRLDELAKLRIFQIGCGGTGSWLVPLLSKFLSNIEQRFRQTTSVEYKLVDGDTVESHNQMRQNFNEIDVGRNKATVLARDAAKNIQTYFNKQNLDTRKKFNRLILSESRENSRKLNLVIGCVDNIKTRRALYSFLKNDMNESTIYIDVGNEVYHGQVVTSTFNLHNLEKFTDRFHNQHAFVNPKFYKIYKNNADEQQDQNCAFFGDQSQGINSLGANLIFLNMQQILINNTLPAPVIEFHNSGFTTFNL